MLIDGAYAVRDFSWQLGEDEDSIQQVLLAATPLGSVKT
jgi:hypothetical protein